MITNEQRQELRQFILENFEILGIDEGLTKTLAKHNPTKLKKLTGFATAPKNLVTIARQGKKSWLTPLSKIVKK